MIFNPQRPYFCIHAPLVLCKIRYLNILNIIILCWFSNFSVWIQCRLIVCRASVWPWLLSVSLLCSKSSARDWGWRLFDCFLQCCTASLYVITRILWVMIDQWICLIICGSSSMTQALARASPTTFLLLPNLRACFQFVSLSRLWFFNGRCIFLDLHKWLLETLKLLCKKNSITHKTCTIYFELRGLLLLILFLDKRTGDGTWWRFGWCILCKRLMNLRCWCTMIRI